MGHTARKLFRYKLILKPKNTFPNKITLWKLNVGIKAYTHYTRTTLQPGQIWVTVYDTDVLQASPASSNPQYSCHMKRDPEMMLLRP